MYKVINSNLDYIREIHWDALHETVDKELDAIIVDGKGLHWTNDKIQEKIPKGEDLTSVLCKTQSYFKMLKTFNENKERNLLIALPGTLRLFIDGEAHYRKTHNISDELWGYWKALLGYVYDYKYFSKKQNTKEDWNAGKLMEELDIHTCCYCNADIVYSQCIGDEEDDPYYRTALDHFYSKSQYPYLALSLYNLVPICDRCNSKFKRDKDVFKLQLFHPHEGSLCSNFEFIFVPHVVQDVYHCPLKGNVRTIVSSLNASSVKASLDLFAVEDVYNKLYHYVIQDIIMKMMILKSSYGKWIYRKLNYAISKRILAKHVSKMSSEEEKFLMHAMCDVHYAEWKKQLFGISFSDEDINKRPFSKLIIDLAGDL